MDLALLWSRAKAGDPGSRCALIEHYAPLAGRIARWMPTRAAMGSDDLESAGLLGLIDAVDRFQPDRGVPFEAYAALRVRGAIIDEIRSTIGRSDRPQQLSLDELLDAGHAVAASDEADPGMDDLRLRVERALRTLPARQREVLARYYGDSLTLREAGARMGISEARACQLHGRAIAALRRVLVPAPRPVVAAA